MYEYSKYKAYAVSEKGQEQFLRIRDRTKHLMSEAGAATMGCLIDGETGLNWEMMACVDRLLELGEIMEVENPYCGAGQDRIFVPGGERR